MATGKRSSEKALQKVLGKGANVNADNPLEVHDPKVGSLISYEGITTADGAGDGSTLEDSVLTTKPDYNGNLVIITSGAYAGQGRDINAATTGGTVTPASAFGGQILSGTNFVIVALRLTPAEVAAIEAKLDHAEHGLAALKALIDAIETKVDAGVPRVYVEQIPDTDFALATIDDVLTTPPPSADAENSIVDIDQVTDSTFVLRSLWVNITSLGTEGTTLTFKLWVLINGVVTEVDSVDVTVLGIQNLVDIFGLQEVHADGIWITVQTDSVAEPGDAACSGTFRYAEAKK